MFPDTITINVTQDDLDNGGQRGERPDAIYLALKRDYPDFGIHMKPNGYVRLTHQDTDKIAWYPATSEYVHLINEIDLTNGNPQPICFSLSRHNPSSQATIELLKYYKVYGDQYE